MSSPVSSTPLPLVSTKTVQPPLNSAPLIGLVALIATSPISGAEFNGGWTVFVDTNGNGVLDTGEDIVRVQPAFRGDMHVTTNAGQTLLTFNGRGFLTPSAAVTFTVCSALAPKSYRIRIEPVGLSDVVEAAGCP